MPSLRSACPGAGRNGGDDDCAGLRRVRPAGVVRLEHCGQAVGQQGDMVAALDVGKRLVGVGGGRQVKQRCQAVNSHNLRCSSQASGTF
jgi:hypothetical protein